MDAVLEGFLINSVYEMQRIEFKSLSTYRSLLLSLALMIWSFSAQCLAQQAATSSTVPPESLSEKVNDPTATLTQAQVQEFFKPSQYGTNAQPNTLQGRFILAVLPHGPLNLAQIVRPTFALMTIPQNKGASSRTEFGDLQLLDLFVMPRSMTEGIDFRWAIRTILCLSYNNLEIGRERRVAGWPGRGIQVSSRFASADFRAHSASNLVCLYLSRPNSCYRSNFSTNA